MKRDADKHGPPVQAGDSAIHLTRCAGFPDPTDPENPQPEPEKTRTLEIGSGFWRVRVRVALK